MKNLLDETTIGNIKLKNRFIRSGTWMRKATEDGDLTEELIAGYKHLAEGKLGLVIAGYARVNQFERANNQMIGMYDDKFIAPMQEFTKMFRDNDTPIGIQLAMGGTQIHFQGDVTWEVMSPTATTITRKDSAGNDITIAVPEMSKTDIDNVIQDFVAAARRVKDSEFDLVQLHAGHGYFLSQWMNPEINTRNDEYGTDRTKFVVDLYMAVRAEVGPDFPIAIKLNSEEKIGDTSNHEAMLALCIKLDELGIDMLEVSGFAPSRTKVTLENESYFAEFATKLKAQVKCPVMLTGGNKTYNNIDKVLKETNVDYIGLSRTLVSEPDLVEKWITDPAYKSRCVSCNHCHRKTYLCVFDAPK
ncbi:NADH:flavin oxidoreductase [Mollicutes bacterium LVI A0039]|nr:NADH:flavin oxidoreductase [Mollicutes bacterium LVI A0039]